MIPFIRSLSELMAITESRESENEATQNHESYTSTMDSGQRKRYARSLNKKEVNLPDIPKTIRHKWIQNTNNLSKFIDELDYNNQIQSSFDLTLLERQNKKNRQDVA
ncbi:hypothetical protein [Prochlorococcus sp. MIT 0916]|uniref:hypothetical protein n=1 Tax=Prochlorococcus sp. MIT 0916 TaxID=3082521 RepID=UPI0039B3D15B